MSSPTENDSSDFDEDVPTETPFNLEQGIWFKYGRLYTDREGQIRSFQNKCGFVLPADFLSLIGDYAEGGFDGWYQVKKNQLGSIVWKHLLLMRLPIRVDLEYEEMYAKLPGREGSTSIVLKLLEQKRSLFYSSNGELAFFPFGRATIFRPDDTGADGFLVFDLKSENSVRYISEEDPKNVPIARSFSEMMAGSVFQFFG